MYLRNVWYVAACDHEVSRQLLSTKVLGERIVLFRTENGEPVALEDACAHRKLPLSMGRLKGDTLECGYHGLTFDCAGQCVRAPGQDRVPQGARVRSYPVIDKWGLVWIWMGERGQADPAKIFPVEHYDDPVWGLNRGRPMEFACNYQYINDNLLDPSHVAWVHLSTFGEPGCEETPLKVEVTDAGVIVSRWMLDREVAPLYKPLVPFSGRADRLQHYEVRYPCHAIIKAVITPAGEGGEGKPLSDRAFVMDSYNLMTPVDEKNTRYYWFQIRNVRPGDEEMSRLMSEGVHTAFSEDKIILEAVQRGMDSKVTPNIDLAIDAGPLRFRRVLERKMAAESEVGVAAE